VLLQRKTNRRFGGGRGVYICGSWGRWTYVLGTILHIGFSFGVEGEE